MACRSYELYKSPTSIGREGQALQGLGNWRPQGDSNPRYRRERGFESLWCILQ
jgi:hypothetical protein